jgi:hypothetical protein
LKREQGDLQTQVTWLGTAKSLVERRRKMIFLVKKRDFWGGCQRCHLRSASESSSFHHGQRLHAAGDGIRKRSWPGEFFANPNPDVQRECVRRATASGRDLGPGDLQTLTLGWSSGVVAHLMDGGRGRRGRRGGGPPSPASAGAGTVAASWDPPWPPHGKVVPLLAICVHAQLLWLRTAVGGAGCRGRAATPAAGAWSRRVWAAGAFNGQVLPLWAARGGAW